MISMSADESHWQYNALKVSCLSKAKSRFESKVDNKARGYPLIDMAGIGSRKISETPIEVPECHFLCVIQILLTLLEVPENHNMTLY